MAGKVFQLHSKAAGRSMTVYYPWSGREEAHKYLSIMLDDFHKLYPWIILNGFFADVSFGLARYVAKYNYETLEHSNEVCISRMFEMPFEIMYILLKQAGADVSKYGLVEVWDEDILKDEGK